MTLVLYVLLSLLFLFEYWFLMGQERDERFALLGLYLLAATFVGTLGVAGVVALTATVEVIGRHWWVENGSE